MPSLLKAIAGAGGFLFALVAMAALSSWAHADNVKPAAPTGPVPASAPATRPALPAAVVVPIAPAVGQVVVAPAGGNVVFKANVRQVNVAGFDPQKNLLEQHKRRVTNLQVAARCTLDQLLRFEVVDGRLQVESHFVAKQSGENRIEVADSNAIWVYNPLYGNGFRSKAFTLARYDFDAGPDQFWSTNITVQDHLIMLNGQGRGTTVFYQQIENAICTLRVLPSNRGAGRAVMMAQGQTLAQLQSQHPDEFRQYLIPLLRGLCGEDIFRPGDADVYGVFSEIAPDALSMAALSSLLPRLEADLFSDRERASRDLARMGRRGILAALHVDPASLSEEQKNRLGAFIVSRQRRTADERAHAAQDPDFLLDCLTDPDASVRQAAKSHLLALVKHPIVLDTGMYGLSCHWLRPSGLLKSAYVSAVETLRANVKKELNK